MRRRCRRLSAWFALIAICFAQFALSAHACSVFEQALPTNVEAVGQMSPCDMGVADQGQPGSAVCLEHCKDAAQLADHHSPVPPVAFAPTLAFMVPCAFEEGATPEVVAHAVHPPPDPLPVFASSGRLRI